jgi:hypothetical protein
MLFLLELMTFHSCEDILHTFNKKLTFVWPGLYFPESTKNDSKYNIK